MKSKIGIIGSGFAGLSSATHLAKAGLEVHVFEKNDQIGGRARQFDSGNGYMFDMGPSWYWMPDVFNKYFAHFGYHSSDFYELKLLDPSYSVIFSGNDVMEIPSGFDDLIKLFESIEPGSGNKLIRFMNEAEYKYEVGVNKLVYKPGLSLFEFADRELIAGVFKMHVFTSLSKHIKKYFSNPKLIALMEFPSLFLGAMPQTTPALYSLMNYAGLKLGTWYPIGGFGMVIRGMEKIAKELGVVIHRNTPVSHINIVDNKVDKLITTEGDFQCDSVIGASDYAHVETLLPPHVKNYKSSYWDKKTFAPSCLIYYLGIDKKVEKLDHHNLFFDADLSQHAIEIYEDPMWPSDPLFYVCCPSKTDESVAPKGHENLFILMPLAPGIDDSNELREKYFNLMMHRIEKYVGEPIQEHIDYQKSYCIKDFISDYNAFKGNAYGLANTLSQTAILKPKVRNKKVKNLFYAGQLTVPGPGVPPSIISGEVAAHELLKNLKPVKSI